LQKGLALPFLTGNLKTSVTDCADFRGLVLKIGENPRNQWQRVEPVFLFPAETEEPLFLKRSGNQPG